MAAERTCIVHYESISKSENLVKGSVESYETLIECSNIRENLAGENYHQEQCRNLAQHSEHDELFYHRECYQRFTYAKALIKRKSTKGDETETRKVQKFTRGALQTVEKAGPRGLFPDICMICKNKVLKVKGVRQSLSKIVTETGESTLKQSAKVRNDYEMIIAV